MASEPDKKDWLIPKRVTIETIFGCNARCVMCPIEQPTQRKKGVMPMEMFKRIIDSLAPYKAHFEMMDLFGLGEPLLDPHIFDRVKYVKQKGFRNIAFATNADLLDIEKQKRLLDSGIDTVIFGIEGVKKETHESIRRRTSFDKVVANCKSILRLRDEGGYGTRFLFRMVRGDNNRDEWEAYKTYWNQYISRSKRDFITAYDVHSWAGKTDSKDGVLKGACRIPEIEKKPCYHIFEILYILSNGSVPLCSDDWLHPVYNFGNVKDKHPIEIWNSEKFKKIRALHTAGHKNKMRMCGECTLLYSAANKEQA